jgi:hypothetical protein
MLPWEVFPAEQARTKPLKWSRATFEGISSESLEWMTFIRGGASWMHGILPPLFMVIDLNVRRNQPQCSNLPSRFEQARISVARAAPEGKDAWERMEILHTSFLLKNTLL